MLFNDTDFISSADMASLDPDVLNASAAEGIPIDGPTGIAAQACNEVGQKILTETQAFTGFMPPFAMPYNQTAAVLNLVGPTINRSRIALSQVVVSSANPTESAISSPSALKRYGIYMALWLFYRAAFYKKVNDRYDKKRLMFESEMCKRYWPRFYNQGLPIAYKPMACPGAIHEYNAGVWSPNNVGVVAGTNANLSTAYDIAITWVDNSKYISPLSKGNAESAPSARVPGLIVGTGQVLQISTVGLNPPNGMAPLNVQLGQSLVVPGNATGWNAYVGPEGGALYLQNATPVTIATTTYTLAGAPVLGGYQADAGQYPDSNLSIQKTLMRG